jgi:hypothetical protein
MPVIDPIRDGAARIAEALERDVPPLPGIGATGS